MNKNTAPPRKDYDAIAESVFSKHREQVDVFESHSMKAKFGQRVTSKDIAALGSQIAAFESYVDFTEATEGSLGSLGQLPLVGIDVITAVYAQSLAPVLASVQPMDEEQGIIWHKVVEAQSDRAGLTKGDLLRDRLNARNNKYNSEYASSTGDARFGKPVADGGVNGAASFTMALPAPIRPQTVAFELIDDDTGDVVGKILDDGNGLLLSNVGSGTIDYATGAVDFTATTNADIVARMTAAGEVSVRGFAQTDFEIADELPLIKPILKSQLIRAEVQAVQLQFGSIQALMMTKRFGAKAADEFAADLTNELTIQQNTRIIEEYVRGPLGNANYAFTAPAGVSLIEHRMGFSSAIGEAEENIVANAGVGAVSNIVAGRTAVTFLRSIPGFKTIKAGTTGNVQVMGELDGIPVIRASGVGLVADNEMVAGYKGVQSIDAPVVVAPVLPLFMTDVDGSTDNALKNAKAAASMTGYKSVCPHYTTRLTLTA